MKPKTYGRGSRIVIGVVAVLFVLASRHLYAQQGEIPPAPATGTIAQDPAAAANAQRIVDGRPSMYGLRRHANPISWIEAGVSSLLETVEKKMPPDKFQSGASPKPPKVSGFKVNLGGLGTGSGYGPAVEPFHNNLFGTGARVEVPMVITYRLYESAGVGVTIPLSSSGNTDRFDIRAFGNYTSRPSDNFYGIGNDSGEGDETQFRSVTRVTGAAFDARFLPRWMISFEQNYRSVGITEPRGGKSAIDAFQGQGVPGLSDTGGILLGSRIGLERQSKNRPYLPNSGGLQRVEVGLNEGISGGDYAYWSYRAAVEQFFPLSKDRRKVIGLRAAVQTDQEKGGSVVPFFDLPFLGGYSTLRGFASRRFTDKSSLKLSVDYRYRIWRYLDFGLFTDAGQVGSEIGDFGWNRFHYGYGFRLIGQGQGNRAVSMDIAFSDEELFVIYLNFAPPF